MRFKSIIAAALIGTTLFTSTGCKDDFSDTNTDPSVINKGDIRFLFTNTFISSFSIICKTNNIHFQGIPIYKVLDQPTYLYFIICY